MDASEDASSLRDAGFTDAVPPDATGGTVVDAAGDAGMVSAAFATQALVGPTYAGSLNNGAACDTSYPSSGFAPVDPSGAPHPLFLYFVGTAFVPDAPGNAHDGVGPMAVAEAMARRGFVAISVAYDNGPLAWLSDHQNQLACMFDASRPQSLIALACALPEVDCGLGIATWGHSQGGLVAVVAHDIEPRVSGAWATGFGGGVSATLSTRRLRVVNGEADTTNGQAVTLNPILGFSAAECPGPDQCLRADGSGWIIVRVADLAMPGTSSADHCWFDRPSCSASEIRLEPNWVAPDSIQPFALESNADWLARTALQRP